MREGGVEPPHPKVQEPKSCASASSATLAQVFRLVTGHGPDHEDGWGNVNPKPQAGCTNGHAAPPFTKPRRGTGGRTDSRAHREKMPPGRQRSLWPTGRLERLHLGNETRISGLPSPCRRDASAASAPFSPPVDSGSEDAVPLVHLRERRVSRGNKNEHSNGTAGRTPRTNRAGARSLECPSALLQDPRSPATGNWPYNPPSAECSPLPAPAERPRRRGS